MLFKLLDFVDDSVNHFVPLREVSEELKQELEAGALLDSLP